jgi:hypothetical protein
MPIDAGMGPDALGPMLAEFDRRVAASGRARSSMTISIYGAPQRAESLVKYKDLGVDRAVLLLSPEPREQVLPKLDRIAEAVRR